MVPQNGESAYLTMKNPRASALGPWTPANYGSLHLCDSTALHWQNWTKKFGSHHNQILDLP